MWAAIFSVTASAKERRVQRGLGAGDMCSGTASAPQAQRRDASTG